MGETDWELTHDPILSGIAVEYVQETFWGGSV